ncbi:unnamed protein product [Blepharisma stoltei]|uniref:Uncharacterized protein n=1 Tax=Blepharisma stoltei TaxID=1481888 RepID=A0AAU9JMC9_9CILI|nr:unnamed protein product [Blepharisma stoltei]
MGCSPTRHRSQLSKLDSPSKLDAPCITQERSIETPGVSPNRKLLLAYYANETTMNGKLKGLFEAIFAKEELEVTTIDLSYHNLNVREIYHLQFVLQNFQNLRELKLNNTEITSKDIKRLYSSLELMPMMQVLELQGNAICNEGIKYLTKLFFRTMKSLKVLNLSNNRFGDEGIATLCKGLLSLRCLEELRLNSNNIYSRGLILLSQTLCQIKTLKRLGLAGNPIDFESVRVLVRSIRSNVNLKELDLSRNGLSKQVKYMLPEGQAVIKA